MKAKLVAILAAAALSLGACATPPGADPILIAQQRVDQITVAYAAIRSAAVFCTSGVVCKDEGVIKAVQAGLVTTDLAVAEAKRLIIANATDTSAMSKYSAIAMSAMEVLAKALQSFGVKIV